MPSRRQAVRICIAVSLSMAAWSALPAAAQLSENYQLFVSNEKSGDVTVIDGGNLKVVATIPVGKRPRGIQSSPDGKSVYVALSGTPIALPPKLDANGNPIFKRGKDDDDDEDVPSDKSADGIGVRATSRRTSSPTFSTSVPILRNLRSANQARRSMSPTRTSRPRAW